MGRIRFYSYVDHIFGIGGEECLKIKSRKKKGIEKGIMYKSRKSINYLFKTGIITKEYKIK